MNDSNEVPQFGDVLSIPSNPEDLFTLLYQIGTGGFGKVYKALHNSTNKIFAIKIIDYTKDCKSNKKSISFNYQSIQQETSVMRLIKKNDYIVKYYGSYYSRKSNTVWLILEYCACGSAVDLMLSMDRTLSEIEVSTIMEQILKGLINIHKINLIHRDVKGSNILLSEDGTAKLGDFGVGIQLTDEEYRTSKKGSPYWMSPQVILNEKYDTKTDIWSLGITCVELVEGEPPNGDLKPMKVMEKIACNPPKVEDIINLDEHTDEFIDFVRLCLEINPNDRPTAEQLIKHPFITKLAHGKEYLANLIRENIDKVEEYRREEEEKEKYNNNNQSENDNENENDNGNNNEENNNEENNNFKNNDQIIPNLSDTNSLKSIENNYNPEKNNNSFSQESVNNYKYSLQNINNDNNEIEIVKENEVNNGSVIIKDEEQNGSLNLVQNNSMLVYDDNNKSINKEENNNEGLNIGGYNEDFNSMVIIDDNNNGNNKELEQSFKEKKVENLGIPDFMKFIESDNFIDSDEKYIEIMQKRQLQEMKEKYEYLKNKKEKKIKEEKEKEKEKNEINNIKKDDEINNIQTPNKKEIQKEKIENNNDKNNNNIIPHINKINTDIKQNQPVFNLLVNEERENKENKEQIHNNNNNNIQNQNQRSCITSNFTQDNSKNDDSSDGKNNLNLNLFLNNKNKISNNKNNLIPLSRKLNFYDNINENETKQDTSNIDISDDEGEKIENINSVINLNYQDNKLEKSFDDKSKYFGKSEVKQNRKNIFDKIKFSENIYNFNLNVNDEDNVKSIHISSFKPHKKYFK